MNHDEDSNTVRKNLHRQTFPRADLASNTQTSRRRSPPSNGPRRVPIRRDVTKMLPKKGHRNSLSPCCSRVFPRETGGRREGVSARPTHSSECPTIRDSILHVRRMRFPKPVNFAPLDSTSHLAISVPAPLDLDLESPEKTGLGVMHLSPDPSRSEFRLLEPGDPRAQMLQHRAYRNICTLIISRSETACPSSNDALHARPR